MPKRGRKSQGGGAAKKARPAAVGLISAGAMKALMKKDAGYVRTGGYYGRFAGRNAELKFFDTANSFLFDTTGEVPATGQLCLIPQGTTESTRIGRKCVIKSIQMRGRLLFTPGAATTGACTTHLYLILDKQANGAAAAATDVMTSTAFADSFHNLANSQRFVVLKAWHHTFNCTAGVSGAYNPMVKYLECFKKCNVPIEYSSTTGAITEIRSNNIFLLAGGDGNGDDLVQFVGNTRLRFSDQ